MKKVITLVLGGGQGSRLYPLTKFRSKPAVPLAGKYRLIDIPLSNCINSGLNRIYVLTQFNSVSLHKHIRSTYGFDAFSRGFVEVLAAQQTLDSSDWYQGTADAVRQNLRYIQDHDAELVLILSGDQLYRMDFRKMIKTHRESEADVTIAALPVPRSMASALGVMRVDDSGRVQGFLEKPQTDEELDLVRTDPAWIDARGINSRGRECLASMGIYLFKRDVLVEALQKTDYRDFGKEVFPASIRSRRVQCHLFDGYWEDIGTIGSFYNANLELASIDPPFEISSADFPIYTRARFLPPTRMDGVTVHRSLIADGCQIEAGAVIENSVIGLRCRIGQGVQIRNSVIMGADYYEGAQSTAANESERRLPLGIGPETVIDGAIIDKNARIGRGVRITNPSGVETSDDDTKFVIRDGVIVIPRETELTDGWQLEV